MLKLVHPADPQGQEKRTRKRYTPRNGAFYPTPQESARIRAAIRNLIRAYGSRSCLAAVLGVRPVLLTEVVCRKTPGSYGLAIMLARAAGTSLEALLSPLKIVDVCPTCGARKGDR